MGETSRGETTRDEWESGRNDSGANEKVGETTRIRAMVVVAAVCVCVCVCVHGVGGFLLQSPEMKLAFLLQFISQ